MDKCDFSSMVELVNHGPEKKRQVWLFISWNCLISI